MGYIIYFSLINNIYKDIIQRKIMHLYENMPSTSSYVRYTSHQNTAQSIKAARLYTTHFI